MKPCCVAILGSTGSIGVNALKVVDQHPQAFRVIALSAYNNFKLLEAQIRKYRPAYVAVGAQGLAHFKKTGLKGIKFYKIEDCAQLASLSQVDVVVLGMRGTSALMPFLAGLRTGKRVAPANKEALVIAGEVIMREAGRHGGSIIPIDSEQSAIFQCLDGQRSKPALVHLTASGGPLREVPAGQFKRMTPEQILRHPRWKMGPKITVDSATLMNKGFEVIEAKHLFNLRWDKIQVLIHPEAIIHSMVEFEDGSWLAQLGITDMRLPIQYALTYPQRLSSGLKSLDLARWGKLHFYKPDLKKFPSLGLAYEAARQAGTLPAVLNAADEEAVEAFLKGIIGFPQIYKVVEKVVLAHRIVKNPGLEAILAADQWARQEAGKIIYKR
ncbi:MAG: 1-deoxy-D-xylulose-5-phosphate reductoisomerase [Candidatus Omnitrophica bacterium]|nr:1-deoxy-D-xylulose-5-phosphate reductoisomerase [Candidatus Omnitrophota bacterium]MDE2222966.1 1-deoxy-D-xylulose-5-phosphate reductoisomerase [Candidatus Omnitrophota bacterium]